MQSSHVNDDDDIDINDQYEPCIESKVTSSDLESVPEDVVDTAAFSANVRPQRLRPDDDWITFKRAHPAWFSDSSAPALGDKVDLNGRVVNLIRSISSTDIGSHCARPARPIYFTLSPRAENVEDQISSNLDDRHNDVDQSILIAALQNEVQNLRQELDKYESSTRPWDSQRQPCARPCSGITPRPDADQDLTNQMPSFLEELHTSTHTTTSTPRSQASIKESDIVVMRRQLEVSEMRRMDSEAIYAQALQHAQEENDRLRLQLRGLKMEKCGLKVVKASKTIKTARKPSASANSDSSDIRNKGIHDEGGWKLMASLSKALFISNDP